MLFASAAPRAFFPSVPPLVTVAVATARPPQSISWVGRYRLASAKRKLQPHQGVIQCSSSRLDERPEEDTIKGETRRCSNTCGSATWFPFIGVEQMNQGRHMMSLPRGHPENLTRSAVIPWQSRSLAAHTIEHPRATFRPRTRWNRDASPILAVLQANFGVRWRTLKPENEKS